MIRSCYPRWHPKLPCPPGGACTTPPCSFARCLHGCRVGTFRGQFGVPPWVATSYCFRIQCPYECHGRGSRIILVTLPRSVTGAFFKVSQVHFEMVFRKVSQDHFHMVTFQKVQISAQKSVPDRFQVILHLTSQNVPEA